MNLFWINVDDKNSKRKRIFGYLEDRVSGYLGIRGTGYPVIRLPGGSDPLIYR